MTVTIWPHRLLPPGGMHFYPNFRGVVGAETPSGSLPRGNLSIGYSWAAQWSNVPLRRANKLLTWYGYLSRSFGQNPIFEVPFIPDLVQPGGDLGLVLEGPFSDGSTFDDGSLWVSALSEYDLVNDLDLNATVARVRRLDGARLGGGHPFGLKGPSGLKRLHMISGLVQVDTDQWDITFTPGAREDYEAEQVVDFANPGCAMFMDPATLPNAYPHLVRPYKAEPTLGFLEAGLDD